MPPSSSRKSNFANSNNQQLGAPTSSPLSHSYRQGINERYTFDNFIVGSGNELAYAACQAIAANPGTKYNPLFLYGGVGIGKTHLIQAVGNAILAANPKARVVYLSTEQFVQEFLDAIRLKKNTDFAGHYRNVDVLIIDDIQFIAGKEKTQEEFFHTFNALHQSNKQIILTSDRPPKSISVIEARLVSRFEWGMIADVGRPDLETRVAIVQRQTQDRGFPLPPDVVNFIAEAVTNNVRELEGALTKLHAYYQLNKVVPNVDVARSLIAALQGDGALGGGLTPKRVIAAVAKYFDVSLENLLGASRRKELVVPRQIAMYLLREDCSSSFPSIGHELGGRDHTTAMHACGKVRKEVERGGKMRGDVEQIRLALGGS
jgi:chromosomal replication initiator protein